MSLWKQDTVTIRKVTESARHSEGTEEFWKFTAGSRTVRISADEFTLQSAIDAARELTGPDCEIECENEVMHSSSDLVLHFATSVWTVVIEGWTGEYRYSNAERTCEGTASTLEQAQRDIREALAEWVSGKDTIKIMYCGKVLK